MRAHLAALALCLGLATPAGAETPTEAATLRLADAALQLQAAEGAGDRIAALTSTVQAYEAGLAAMREGLVAAALRERELTAELAEEDAGLAEFLALLRRYFEVSSLSSDWDSMKAADSEMLINSLSMMCPFSIS